MYIFTFILLILEAGWFLGDLGLIKFKYFSTSSRSSIEKPIGVLSHTKRNVRRRVQDSIIWEESAAKDSIYNHDSILTLSQSTALLELDNQSKISLSENTLILVELPDEQGDSRIRLKFSKGDIKTRALARKMEISTKSFTIDAAEDTDLNLRSVGEETVEVEITKGTATLRNETNNQSLNSGELALLNNDSIASTVKLQDNLKWITPDGGRAYSHNLPVGILLKWEGTADSLWHLKPDGQSEVLTISGQSAALTLGAGSHNFRLKSQDRTSKTLQLSIWKAPIIHLLSPLPRDRLSLSAGQTFSWVATDMAKEYRVQFSHDNKFSNLILDKKAAYSSQKISLDQEGDIYWKVEGIDELGYVIPPPYKNQIFNYQDLLDAPTLKAPRAKEPLREPSNEQKSAPIENEGAMINFLEKIYSLILPSAEAKTAKYDVEFEWEKVNGADHYVVEIDREGNFLDPMVVVKVEGESFLWKECELGGYFWRVAAGRGSKMGKFSQASFLDMSKAVRDVQAAKEMGITIKEAEAVTPIQTPTPKPIPEVKPLPAPPKKVVLTEPVVTPPKKVDVAEAPKPNPPPEAKPEVVRETWWRKTRINGSLLIGSAYEMKTINAPDSLESEFQGFITTHGKLELESVNPDWLNILLHSNFDQNKWEAKSEVLYPFQNDVTTSSIRNAIMVLRQKYYLGLAVSKVSMIERLTFDELVIKENWLYGVAGFLKYDLGRHFLARHEMSVSVGSGVVEIFLQNDINYVLGKLVQFDLQFGADLNLGIQSGKERDSTLLSAGFTLGASW